jgi:hypothetical protein
MADPKIVQVINSEWTGHFFVLYDDGRIFVTQRHMSDDLSQDVQWKEIDYPIKKVATQTNP